MKAGHQSTANQNLEEGINGKLDDELLKNQQTASNQSLSSPLKK